MRGDMSGMLRLSVLALWCAAMPLAAQRGLTIQLSGDDAATVGIVITAVSPS